MITYEFENVPVDGVRRLAERIAVRPGPASLETAQDRLAEKALFAEVGLPVPVYAAVDDLPSLRTAIGAVGLPAVLKIAAPRVRRQGSGGDPRRGACRGRLARDRRGARDLEALVPFDGEVSILGVRASDGEARFWPLIENQHGAGSSAGRSRRPATWVHRSSGPPKGYARAVMERLDHVGVLAIELFRVGEDLYGNELAPRVHNSGPLDDRGSRDEPVREPPPGGLRAATG